MKHLPVLIIILTGLFINFCGKNSNSISPSAEALETLRVIQTEHGPVNVITIASGLEHPWSLESLPEGPMLVTERAGRLRSVSTDGRLSEPIKGVPEVFARGQGGLLDVIIDPDFKSNRFIYMSYAAPGKNGAYTAAARGRLSKDLTEISGLQVIFRQEPGVSGAAHFGSRLAFARDGTLFITLGERFKFDPAQDLTNHLGKIVRINSDGSIPDDNPFSGRNDVKPEIWSYGHRNVQGAALHPETGELWTHELGPKGGDALNIPKPGLNYGWPLVSFGRHYTGINIPDPPTKPELPQPIYHWTPAVSPSGMTFYTGNLFTEWKGNILMGGLASRLLVRLTLKGNSVTGEERINMGARIREVHQGANGEIYLLTDSSDGKILQLTPGYIDL